MNQGPTHDKVAQPNVRSCFLDLPDPICLHSTSSENLSVSTATQEPQHICRPCLRVWSEKWPGELRRAVSRRYTEPLAGPPSASSTSATLAGPAAPAAPDASRSPSGWSTACETRAACCQTTASRSSVKTTTSTPAVRTSRTARGVQKSDGRGPSTAVHTPSRCAGPRRGREPVVRWPRTTPTTAPSTGAPTGWGAGGQRATAGTAGPEPRRFAMITSASGGTGRG